MKTKISTLLILLLPFFSSSQILWDNFENTRIGYYNFSHGDLTTRFDNPMPTSTVNSSELCAQYVRNPSETYDVIVILANGLFLDLTDYLSGTKKMTVDVFSPGPGIPLQITLEDSTVAGSNPYPFGRHSIYTATTTATNEWETIEFVYVSQPDNTISDGDVTSMILSFDLGNNTNDIYYFDNIYGPEFDNQCEGVSPSPDTDFADWDCNWNLSWCKSASACSSYHYMSGWLNQAYNPDTTTINTSKYSGFYTRNPDVNGEDVFISYFSNGPLDLSVNKYFNFKLYGPPRPIYMSFQDDSSNEVFAFNSALLSNNQWQQFTIDLSSVSSQDISRFVLFFDQGLVNWDTYYLDDFVLSSIPLTVEDNEASDLMNIYPQPANSLLNIDLRFNNIDELSVALYDIKGKELVSTIVSQNFNNISLDVSKINPGIYFVKVQSKDNFYTKKLQIIR